MTCGKSHYIWVFKKYSNHNIFSTTIFKSLFKSNKTKNEPNEKRRQKACIKTNQIITAICLSYI